jgi:hypothetical protein
MSSGTVNTDVWQLRTNPRVARKNEVGTGVVHPGQDFVHRLHRDYRDDRDVGPALGQPGTAGLLWAAVGAVPSTPDAVYPVRCSVNIAEG